MDAPSAPPKGGVTGVSFRSVMICHRVVVCPQASRPRVHIAPAPIGRRAAVHERCEGRGAGWRHHAAFERRRDALVFLDTTTAASGGESVTTAPARRRETPEPSQEPPQSSPRRTPKGPITHDLDETRSQDIPWSLCGVLLYDPRQIAKEGEPATCGKCQRFRSAASYRKRQAAMKAAKKET